MQIRCLTSSASVVLLSVVLTTLTACKDREAKNRAFEQGLKAEETRDFDLAIACFSQAIKIDSTDGPSYRHRGHAYWVKDDVAAAIADYDKAIQIVPTDAKAFQERSEVYNKKGEFDKAIADASEAIRLEPQNPKAYVSRGSAYKGKAQFPKAMVDFKQAIRLDPQSSHAYTERGLAFMAVHDDRAAILDLEKATTLDQADASPSAALAIILATSANAEIRDGVKALEYAQKANQFAKDKPVTWDLLALAYAESGDFKHAIEFEKRYLDWLKPDSDEAKEAQQKLDLFQSDKPFHYLNLK